MSNLRRRIFGSDSASSSRAPSPAPAIREPASPVTQREGATDGAADSSLTGNAVRVPADKLERLNSYVTSKSEQEHKHKRRPGRKRRTAWIFGLGGLFGIVVAGVFAANPDVLDLAVLNDMDLSSLLDVLPSGLVQDAHALQVCPYLIT